MKKLSTAKHRYIIFRPKLQWTEQTHRLRKHIVTIKLLGWGAVEVGVAVEVIPYHIHKFLTNFRAWDKWKPMTKVHNLLVHRLTKSTKCFTYTLPELKATQANLICFTYALSELKAMGKVNKNSLLASTSCWKTITVTHRFAPFINYLQPLSKHLKKLYFIKFRRSNYHWSVLSDKQCLYKIAQNTSTYPLHVFTFHKLFIKNQINLLKDPCPVMYVTCYHHE